MSAAWLRSRRFDLAAFGAPVVLALGLMPLGPWLAPEGAMPVWAWIVFVLGVDVAHVWSTLYVTYLDPEARRQRRTLLWAAPLAAYGFGVVVALEGFHSFWRAMAYLAVFHFVRQQYGWVRLYGRKDPGLKPWDRHLDAAAIYVATLYPVLWWHAHLPRPFEWFIPEDFVAGLPSWVSSALLPVYAGTLALFTLRQWHRHRQEGFVPWGKVLLVAGTVATWGAGIILARTDWAFTVSNVIVHGVPYVAFIWVVGVERTRRREAAKAPAGGVNRAVFVGTRGLYFVLLLLALAYFEEYLWDRTLWTERGAVFPGPELTIRESWVPYWMPLLSLPQVTHYILDGFIWKRVKGRQRSQSGPV